MSCARFLENMKLLRLSESSDISAQSILFYNLSYMKLRE